MNARILAVAMAVLTSMSLLASPARADEVAATPPKFAETSKGPVLLRYQFKPGLSFDNAIDMTININMDIGGQKIRVPTVMKMNFLCSVDSITPDGNARLNAVFTRVAMTVEGPQQTVKYDSDVDKDPAQPELKALAAMLNQNVPCTVTPRGEVSDIDLHFMKDAMQKVGEAATFDSIEQSVTQGLHGAFVQLAEKPVSVGDVYDAGKVTQKMAGLGSMTATVKYEVRSISGDKKKVILKPVMKFDMDLPPNSPLHVDSMVMDGWLLFDCERGNIARSYGQMKMAMSAAQDGQKMTMAMDMTMKYVTADRPAGTVAPK